MLLQSGRRVLDEPRRDRGVLTCREDADSVPANDVPVAGSTKPQGRPTRGGKTVTDDIALEELLALWQASVGQRRASSAIEITVRLSACENDAPLRPRPK